MENEYIGSEYTVNRVKFMHDMEKLKNGLIQHCIRNDCITVFRERFASLLPFFRVIHNLEIDEKMYAVYLSGQAVQFLIGRFNNFKRITFSLVQREQDSVPLINSALLRRLAYDDFTTCERNNEWSSDADKAWCQYYRSKIKLLARGEAVLVEVFIKSNLRQNYDFTTIYNAHIPLYRLTDSEPVIFIDDCECIKRGDSDYSKLCFHNVLIKSDDRLRFISNCKSMPIAQGLNYHLSPRATDIWLCYPNNGELIVMQDEYILLHNQSNAGTDGGGGKLFNFLTDYCIECERRRNNTSDHEKN